MRQRRSTTSGQAARLAPQTPPALRREFPARPAQVPLARHWARRTALQVLGADADVAGDAALVVGELAANVLRHAGAPTAPFTVLLAARPGGLRIEVRDDGPGRPVLLRSGAGEESGRGLLLVDALARAWGWTAAADGPGKTVWAELGGEVRPAAAAGSGGRPPAAVPVAAPAGGRPAAQRGLPRR